MSLGKYLTNVAVIGAVVGAFGTARQTQSMPRDWRRLLVWGAWAAGLALAVAGVAKKNEDEQFDAQRREDERARKGAAKARRAR